ncbi:MAG: UDP-3-O-acyl-N-acetylglucosamine deacetylase [Lactobacillaceae bacterium]|jgi:UDP-3-O-[3-hydroxymyristoyl] N-acetylglucosamine deacetylase|nr:UDP-3-O-acyl-N-acetylglucosamine deacetylase [Lactobacillaceae bacterium]
MQQQTVKEFSIDDGIGLHSGNIAKLRFLPAKENTGIVFRRVDLENKPEIKALYSNVVDTKNSTNLGFDGKMYVRTIEHLMCGLYMAGVDNAIVEIDNEEMPIFDGSASIFSEMFKKDKIIAQNAPRKFLKVKKAAGFTDNNGNTVSIKPYNNGLKVNFEIEFPSPIVGHQMFSAKIDNDIYQKEIMDSRTFCEKYQVDYLQSIGLAKGGSLDNAVVLDGDKILNPGGLRHEKECVNHKVLDIIGDMYTSGYHIIGEITASKTGHFHSNELLKILFSDTENYEII